jgi:glycosyltransferase involved in cell wall biosynthesis
LKNQVAVLIPVYNESATIAKVIHDFQEALPDARIYVYDNNSSDSSGELAKAAGATVKTEPRQGKGHVLARMFRDIEADCFVLVDGDDTYPAGVAPEMVSLVLEDNADMVVGDRLASTYFTVNTRRFHNKLNVLVRNLINICFQGNVNDALTGYRAFSPAFVKTIPLLSQGFEVETEMTIEAIEHNMRICQIPVTYRERPEGSVSKLRTFKDGLRILKMIFHSFRHLRPLLFYSLVSLCFFLLTIFLGVLSLLFPVTLIFVTCAFSAFLTVSSLLAGLIGNTVAKQAKQTFQTLLKQFPPRL